MWRGNLPPTSVFGTSHPASVCGTSHRFAAVRRTGHRCSPGRTGPRCHHVASSSVYLRAICRYTLRDRRIAGRYAIRDGRRQARRHGYHSIRIRQGLRVGRKQPLLHPEQEQYEREQQQREDETDQHWDPPRLNLGVPAEDTP